MTKNQVRSFDEEDELPENCFEVHEVFGHKMDRYYYDPITFKVYFKPLRGKKYRILNIHHDKRMNHRFFDHLVMTDINGKQNRIGYYTLIESFSIGDALKNCFN